MDSWKINPLLVIILCLVLVTNLNFVTGNINISAAREAYFRELQHMRAYEVTMPIVYKIPLLNVKDQIKTLDNRLLTLHITNNETLLPSINELRSILYRLINLEEEMISDFDEATPKLRKRSIMDGINSVRDFFGDILITCYRVLTYRDGKSMLQNEKSIATSYEKLKQTMINDHQQLIQINKKRNKLIDHISSLDEKLSGKFMEIDRYLHSIIVDLNLEQVLHTQDFLNLGQSYYNTLLLETLKFRQLLDSCKNFKLSTNIVDKQTLKNDLTKLEHHLKKLKMKLVIPISEITAYYHNQLTNCHISDNFLEIDLKIPIQNITKTYKILETITIPFYSNNKICRIKAEDKIIITDDTRTFSASFSVKDLQFCDTSKSLCKIPSNRGNSKFDSCMRAIYKKEPQSKILQKCIFSCQNRIQNEIITTQLEENIFSITNFGTLLATDTSSNKGETIYFEENHHRAYIMYVPCATEILNIDDKGNSELIIPTGIPCLQEIKS